MFHLPLCDEIPPQEPPDPALFGEWERFEPVQPLSPVRTVPITPEVLAEDAARRARQAEPFSEWRARVRQSTETLTTPRRTR